MELLTNTNRIK